MTPPLSKVLGMECQWALNVCLHGQLVGNRHPIIAGYSHVMLKVGLYARLLSAPLVPRMLASPNAFGVNRLAIETAPRENGNDQPKCRWSGTRGLRPDQRTFSGSGHKRPMRGQSKIPLGLRIKAWTSTASLRCA